MNDIQDNIIENRKDIDNLKSDGYVTSSKLADNAVIESKISNDSITTDKIKDKSITQDKIAENVLENYVKFNDYATTTKTGVVKYNNTYGISVNSDGYLYTILASENDIKLKTDRRKPIVPSNLNYAVRSVYPITQTSLTDPITVNTIYDLGVQSSLSINLPSGNLGDFIQFDFISTDTATTLTVEATVGLTGYDLIPETNMIYTLYFDYGVTGYDGTNYSYGWRFNYSEYTL